MTDEADQLLAQYGPSPRTLSGQPVRPELPDVMPRELHAQPRTQLETFDHALKSFGQPAVDATIEGMAGRKTPAEVAWTFLTEGPMGPFGMARAPRIANPIRAYHGSPHDFDEFRMDRIGTGEGAQAYGHGLYFAEHEGVARGYRDNLARPNGGWSSRPEPDGPNRGLYQGTSFYPGNDLRVRERRFFPTPEEARAWALAEADKAPPGRMYEVNLHARPEQFLDWDRPLSGQSDHVRQRLGPQIENALEGNRRFNAQNGWGSEPTGSHFAPQNDMQLRQLTEADISGIRYLDQGSRADGLGTSNYVVFNPNIIQILRKYGIPGSIGGATTADILNQYGPRDGD